MIKRILYIAFQYEYGFKANGPALNYKAWYENFLKLGFEVETVFYEDFSKDALQGEIINKASAYQPDLVFFILQKEQIEVSTLKKLKSDGFFIVNFFGDDQWRFDSFSSLYAPHFSACITTDKFSIRKYQNIGQKNIIRSQWASLESNVHSESLNYQYDVSFIGGANPYRKWFVNELKKKGITVQCFGQGWENGRVSFERMEEIFATSKINLNLSNSISYDIRYLLSSLKAAILTFKALIKSGKNASQTKARNFEIPVQGGFQLTDYVPSLEDYFRIGEEVVCYTSVEDAALLIAYYLENETKRESIKKEGVNRARYEHTFKHRIVEFIKVLEEMKNGLQ